MKIALCSSFVPFVRGGARNIVDWLAIALRDAGHQVETIYIPEVDEPDLLIDQMFAFRWLDLSAADRVICFRPQSHLIRHPNKIVWFIHHIRLFYDLWDTPYRTFPDDSRHRGIRETLHALDREALLEAKAVFSNSSIVKKRLKAFNDIDCEVLYPPVWAPERFYCADFNDEIVSVCRLEHHKRPHLLIDAMSHTQSNVKLRLAGQGSASYVRKLKEQIAKLGLSDRVLLEERWISEAEKVGYLANCLASAYLPLDEDSYGYPTIEAAHAAKPTLTVTDAGGVGEFVIDGINGVIAEPSPQSIAAEMDRLFVQRATTSQMGINARDRIAGLDIRWSTVLERLLA
ncbi:MAG: glycosyltransferase family 4 protein [Hyphomicrobium sp.]|uniref:glycosyltransferase family 4 protein n=1 Tax=Hyphomicrobium sp. TaxID=82 RepID=UPI0039E2B322